MSGLLFRADELRDATTRRHEYQRRKAHIIATVQGMPHPRYQSLVANDTEAWWLQAQKAVLSEVARAIRGQRVAVEVRQRWEKLPNLIRRLKKANNIHPLRSIK